MHTHTISPTNIATPAGSFTSATEVIEGDTIWNLDGVVNANGGAANTIDFAFDGGNMKSIVLLATVPCVVTLVHATNSQAITLVANVPTHLKNNGSAAEITDYAFTSISIGANTTGSGAAGTIKIAALYNS